ncbi:MAG: hypothetical protein M1816_006727 [Peltula sp. TS41687]|nr:MAG: hypothetical protein M1816_006727 [Peltula sp. TS41687]
MAALLQAANAKIRSHPVLNYVCSTHFWGPVSNFGIPIAAVMDTQKEPEIISGKMTGALIIYSATFMRYALAVTPKNYLLFGCHAVNEMAQLTQGWRWLAYWRLGGRERALEAQQQRASLSSSSGGGGGGGGGSNSTKGNVGDGIDSIKGVGAEVMQRGKEVVEATREKVVGGSGGGK